MEKGIHGLTMMSGGVTVKEEVLKKGLGARKFWGVEELRNKCDKKKEEMGVYRSIEGDEVVAFPRH